MRYMNWKLAAPFYAREELGGPFREMETEAGDLREPDLSRYANLFSISCSLLRSSKLSYRVFSHDVTAAILVSQNNEMAAMLVSQTSPVGAELLSYANAFFCSNKFA